MNGEHDKLRRDSRSQARITDEEMRCNCEVSRVLITTVLLASSPVASVRANKSYKENVQKIKPRNI